jgi:hypothetical protein
LPVTRAATSPANRSALMPVHCSSGQTGLEDRHKALLRPAAECACAAITRCVGRRAQAGALACGGTVATDALLGHLINQSRLQIHASKLLCLCQQVPHEY